MGELLKAYCEKCGFTKKTCLGSGEADFDYNCNFPAIDLEYNKFTVGNILKEEESKGRYKFYNDPTMFLEKPEGRVHKCRDYSLQRENNYCPICERFTMKFESDGNYD